MLDKDSPRLSPAIQRIVRSFRWYGWSSFWIQIILAVVSSLTLLFSTVLINFQTSSDVPRDNPGAGIGLALAGLGLLALYGGAYWAFRYTRLSRQLRLPDSEARPRPSDVVRSLRIGLIVNMAGMLLTLLGGEALIGALVSKALSQPQGGAAIFERITQAIQPLDIWVIQANINIALAHFFGIAVSLWLVQIMGRQ
ncbi:MAG: DUF3611 family protein [Elainellaceae cyanobacterium]